MKNKETRCGRESNRLVQCHEDGSTGIAVERTNHTYKILWDDPRKTESGRDWSHVNHDKVVFTDATSARINRHRFN
jgi:hypothetical protein